MSAAEIERSLRQELSLLDEVQVRDAARDAGAGQMLFASRDEMIEEMVRLELYAAFH